MALLMLVQYTSVAALLVITSFVLLIDLYQSENSQKTKKKILLFTLFTIGLMIRVQSIIIVAPFMGIYLLAYITKYFKEKQNKEKLIRIIKDYIVYLILIIVVYTSSTLIYNSDKTYKEFMEHHDRRAFLHDMTYVDYDENKEIFDEIGWSKNDHYLFYTFNFGDENIFSKENIEKIYNYKIKKDGKYTYDINLNNIKEEFVGETTNYYVYIVSVFLGIFLVTLTVNKKKIGLNTAIFLTTIGLHILFILINRSVARVIIPEYIIRNDFTYI